MLHFATLTPFTSEKIPARSGDPDDYDLREEEYNLHPAFIAFADWWACFNEFVADVQTEGKKGKALRKYVPVGIEGSKKNGFAMVWRTPKGNYTIREVTFEIYEEFLAENPIPGWATPLPKRAKLEPTLQVE